MASAGVVVPAYLVGSPDAETPPRTYYFDSAASFLTANGALPLLHVLFGVVFLGRAGVDSAVGGRTDRCGLHRA